MLQASTPRRIAAQADSPAAPTIGAATASCTIRANLIAIPQTHGRDADNYLLSNNIRLD